MAEWVHEDGIGEERAALIDDGRIVAALIVPDTAGPRWGSVHTARLGPAWRDRRVVDLDGGGQAFLDHLAAPATEGGAIVIEISREGIAPKVAHARHLPDGGARAATLIDELVATGAPVTRLLPHQPDTLEAAGWSELLAEAESGDVAFDGGVLHIDLTRAMTTIDIDGAPPLDRLAIAGATAAARTIARLGIGGSIGIDFPTLGSKAERQAAAAAFDTAMYGSVERTAINGFGLMQVVREKRRASLIELLRGDPARAAATALLRRAQRSSLVGPVTLVAHPAVTERLGARADWRERLARHLGGATGLRADAALAISGGYVEAA